MNHIYKVIFNKSIGTFVAVAEHAKGQGKKSNRSAGSACKTSDSTVKGALLNLAGLKLSLVTVAVLAGLGVGVEANAEVYSGTNYVSISDGVNAANSPKGNFNNNAAAGNPGAIAIGPDVSLATNKTIVIGDSATSNNTYTFNGVTKGSEGDVVIGADTSSSITYRYPETQLAGYEWIPRLNSSNVVMGNQATSESPVGGAVVLGDNARNETFAGIAIGQKARVTGIDGTGTHGTNNGVQGGGIAIGSHSNSIYSGETQDPYDGNATPVAVGSLANSLADGAVSFGETSIAHELRSVALGSKAESDVDYGVAIGGISIADRKGLSKTGVTATSDAASEVAQTVSTAIPAGYDIETELYPPGFSPTDDRTVYTVVDNKVYAAPNATSNDVTDIVNTVKSDRDIGEMGAVSVGNKDNTRQIINVAAGSLDSDAVNVAQLKSVANIAAAADKDTYFHTNTGTFEFADTDNNPKTPDVLVELTAGNNATADLTVNNRGGIEEAAGAAGYGSVTAGVNAVAAGHESIAIGESASVVADATGIRGIAIGNSAQVRDRNGVSIGGDSKAGNSSVALGTLANATNVGSTALGQGSSSGTRSVSVGQVSAASGTDAVSVGYQSKSSALRSSSLGYKSQASETDAVALGANSIADRGIPATSGYDASTGTNSTETSPTWRATTAAVSVGDGTTLTRQITSVAAGSEDTDAVNVAQLKAVANVANTPLTFTGNTNADTDAEGTYTAGDGTQRQLGETLNIIGATTNTGVTGLTTDTNAPTAGDYSAKNVQTVVTDGQVQVQLAQNPEFSTVTADTMTVNNADTNTNYVADGSTSVVNGDNVYDAIQSTTYQYTGDNDNTVITRTPTQTLSLIGGATSATDNNIKTIANTNGSIAIKLAEAVDLGANGSVTTGNTVVDNSGISIINNSRPDGTVSLTNAGLNNGKNVITNVASGGTTDTNAANIGDVNAAKTTVTSSNNSISVTDTNNGTGNLAYDITVDAQGLAESAQLPVVYTNADGDKVYKQANGEFNTAADGSGTPVTSGDVIASVQNADGSTTNPTTLTNVADGTISNNSTDAINGSQLFDVSTSTATALGGGATVNQNGTITAPTYTLTDGNPSTGNTTAYDNVGDALTGLNTAVNQPLTITGNDLQDTDNDGSQQQLGSILEISGGATAASSNTNVKTVITDGKVDIQLLDAPTFTGTVSAIGVDAGGAKITNVAIGEVSATSTDAVNGSQLNTVQTNINRPLTFSGNTNLDTDTTGGAAANDGTQRQLGETLNIIGSTVTPAQMLSRDATSTITGNEFSAKNVQTVVTNGEVQIQLSENPVFKTMKLVDDNDNVTTLSSTVRGLDVGGDKIVNVAAGDDTTDAVNLGQLRTLIDNIDVKNQTLVTQNSPVVYTADLGPNNTPTQLVRLPDPNNTNKALFYKVSDTTGGVPNTGASIVPKDKVYSSALDAEGGFGVNERLTNIKSTLPRTSGSAAYNMPTSENLTDKEKQNAATVDDVLNAGWNLKTNTKVLDNGIERDIEKDLDFVTPYDTVVFKDGENTKVVSQVDSAQQTSTIQFDVVTDGDIVVDATTGVVGTPINGSGIVTAETVSDAIRASGFTLTSSASAGTVSGKSNELINAGDTITLDAGKNIAVVQAGGTITVATKDDVVFDSVTAGTRANQVVLDKDGVNVGGKTYINSTGLNANSNKIINVAVGTASTDVANVGQLSKVEAGTNVASVIGVKDSTTGQTTYTVNADGAKVTAGSTAVSVVDTTNTTTNVTDYVVDLSTATKASLVNADTALQSVVTQIDGTDVKTINKTSNSANFKTGDNIVLTNNNGAIQIATAKDVTFDSVAAKTMTVNNANSLAQGGSKDYVTAGSQDVVNGGDVYNAISNTEQQYKGDNAGVTITRKPNDILTLIGGATSSTENNIQTVANANGAIAVKLAEAVNLGANGSVSTGNTVVNNAGVSISNGANGTVSLTNAGLDNGNNPITNVTSGGNVDSNAANIGDVNAAKTTVQSSNNSISVVDTNNGTGNLAYDIQVNAQGVTESAQMPVVYTNANGDRLYRQTNGSFNTAVDGSGTTEAPADIIASLQNANGSTSAPTKLANVADGTISNSSTNAINGSQLFDTSTSTATALGGGATVNTNGTITAPTYTINNPADGVVKNVDNVGDAVDALNTAVNSPLTFTGDTGSFERKLGQTTIVQGGITDASKLSDNNIGVVANNGTLDIKLGKTLTGLDSITSGKVTAGTGANQVVLDDRGINVGGNTYISNSGINANNSKVTNVANGDITASSTDAINGSQLSDTNNQVAGNTTALGGGAQYDPATDIYTAPTYITVNPVDGTDQTANNVGGALTNLSDAVNQPRLFNGDSGTQVSQQLGKVVNIQGGSTATLTNNNIGVVGSTADNTLTVKLAEAVNLGANGSVSTGNTVVNNAGVSISNGANGTVSLTNAGLDNGNNPITNVASGGTTANNAANIGDVNAAKTTVQSSDSSVSVKDTNNGTGNLAYDIRVNAQDVAEAAQLPVVYTNAAGDKLYKQTNGDFNTAVDGTGTPAAPADIIASIQNADGTTTAPTKLTNINKGSNDTDAVNVSQLKDAATALGGGATVNSDGTFKAPTYTVNNPADGAATSVNNVGAAVDALNTAVNSPLTFTGDTGSFERKLGQTTIVQGGITDASKLSDNNIGVVANNGTLDIKLGKTLTGLDSITSGKVTAGTGATQVVLDDTGLSVGGNTYISNAGINAGNKAITNVANGVNPNDAANMSQLNNTNAAIAQGFNIAADNGATDNIQLGNTVTYTADDNNVVTTARDNAIGFKLADTLTIGATNPIAIDGTQGTIAGLTNTSFDAANYVPGQAATEDQLAQVATVANNAAEGWNLSVNGDASTVTAVKPTNTVDIANADSNIHVSKSGNNITVGLADDIAVNSVTAGNTTLNTKGITLNGGVNETVALTNQGLDNGNNIITNVASGLAGKPLADITSESLEWNNAATVGDLTQVESNVTNVTQNIDNIYEVIGGQNVDGNAVDGSGTTITDDAGKPLTAAQALITYNVDERGEFINNSVISAVHNMNEEGIKFFHTNDEIPSTQLPIEEKNNVDAAAGGAYSTAIGYQAEIDYQAANAVAIGKQSRVYTESVGAIAIGQGATVGNGDSTLADEQRGAVNSIAIGTGATVIGNNSIAMGVGNVVNGNNSGAFGDPSTIDADNAYSIGNNNQLGANAKNTFVLGNAVETDVANSVALGNQTTITAGTQAGTVNAKADGTAGKTTTAGDKGIVNQATVAGITYKGFAGATADGAVSVGAAGSERRVQNVAAGEISATSTDAINGSQLNMTNHALNDLGYKLSQDIEAVGNEANAGISSAMAMAALPQAYISGKSMVTGGMATYNGEGAVAVGLSKLSDNGRWVMKISGSADTEGNAGGAVGAGFHF